MSETVIANTGEVKIDQEFKDWLMPLATSEREQLELSLISEGCRDPLVLWGDILIDGHNRFDICTRYQIPFKTVQKEFESRDEAKNWIITNQIGRRNITSEQRDYLIGRLYKEQKQQGARTDITSAQNEQKLTTAEKLGEQFKVSRETVKRAEKFAEAVDTIAENCGDEIKTKILTRSLDISKDEVQALAKKPVEEQKAVIAKIESGEVTTLKRAQQAVNHEKKRAFAQSLATTEEFNVIYADPAWQYDNAGVHGAADDHYPTMPLQEICDLVCNIGLQIADNAVLFLWVTNPFLQDALKVVKAWGFEYKTNIVWVKEELKKPGSGFYVRGRHELLFICTRGSFTPLDTTIEPIGSVITAPLGEHSAKPEQAYEIIEKLYPGCNYIELFARNTRSNWKGWGYDYTA